MQVALYALGVIVAIAAAILRSERSRQPSTAQRMWAVAQRLAGRIQDNAIVGTCNGIAFAYHFGHSLDAIGQLVWTDIDVELPAAYPLIIHVRPRRPWFGARIADGPLREISLGHAAFDAKYSLTAAPVDIVGRLLGDDLRAWLSAHEGSWLDTMEIDSHKLLRLSLAGWNIDLDSAEAVVRALTGVAARMRDAFAIDDGLLAQRDDGAPYRPVPDAPDTAELTARREREVAQLRAAWAWPTRRRS